MKRFTLLTMLVVLLGMTAFAQNELVTPPETAQVETWYTTSGNFMQNTQYGLQDNTALMPTINVAIDGADIYIQGLSIYFKEGWIKGSISEATATFANGQRIGGDDYGSIYIVGANDTENMSESIVFSYNEVEGVLKAETPLILENSSTTELSPYCYWLRPVFSKTAPPSKLVNVPEGLVAEEWVVTYVDNQERASSAPLRIGFDGDDVYMQGISTRMPNAWIKGTKDGTLITFPGKQFLGLYQESAYYGYELYLQETDVQFIYNSKTNTMRAINDTITTKTSTLLLDNVYVNSVIKKVVEKAATPAAPTLEMYDTFDGPVALFSIPVLDVNGDGMAASKLSYQFLSDIEHEISSVTFSTADYPTLQQSMTLLPYGFSDNNLIFPAYAYLKQADYSKWNKIGIQTIYTGGDVENKSEVVWVDLKDYGSGSGEEQTAVVAPENLVAETYVFNAVVEKWGELSDLTLWVKAGFDGNDAYIQGLAADADMNAKEMWVKATKNDAGQYVIPANQLMGTVAGRYGNSDYFFTAVDADGNMVDVVLNYDAEKGQFTTDQKLVINGLATEVSAYESFTNVTVTKFNEVAATPAAPTVDRVDFEEWSSSVTCTIPAVGTNGETLNPGKLFYTVWIEKDGQQQPYTFKADGWSLLEDTTEPSWSYNYNSWSNSHNIYFQDTTEECATWTKIGVQSIYYGAGETHKTDIAWLATTGISTVKWDGKTGKVAIYNVAGQRLNTPQKGLNIINGCKVVVK